MKRNFIGRLWGRSNVRNASAISEAANGEKSSDGAADVIRSGPSEQPLKIWIMNHYATEMFFNHAGRHYWFAKKLEQRGFSPTVFTASSFHNRPESIDTNGKRYKIMYTGDTPFVFVKATPASGNGIARIRNMLQFFFGLFPSARGYAATCGKPDIIIGSSVHPLTMVAGLLIARRMKVPCICEIRDLWPEAIFSFGKTT
ncbi:MAG: glycosyltransferase family 4 protein, partial [Ruminococcaceae bacterium]|nr:glycosyltransferase family 4 protein [Oscillospiraceae bacterium]